MKSAIVTGATGAIGTALVAELVRRGIEVLVFCRRESPRNHRIPASPLVTRLDCDLDGLKDVQNTTGKSYDVFYHLAWEGTFGGARNDMLLQHRNIGRALDAVAAAKRFGCDAFIGVGSQAEYGRVEGALRPDTPAFPENGYGMGKLAAGLMTRQLAGQLALRHIWVRVLSVYGPNDGSQSMVMSTLSALREGRTPRFTPAEQLWDYLYSGDAARALCLMGERGRDQAVYVLGSGQALPLRRYIEIMRDVANPGAALDIGALPYAERQVMHLCADISILSADTGWQPEVDFETGIRRTLAAL